jgi:hypothetical protein
MPSKTNSFSMQLALAMAAAEVPANAPSVSKVSFSRTSYTVQPSGTSPQWMSMETAVAVCVPDAVAVGAGVFVTVGRETAVNFESVEGF